MKSAGAPVGGGLLEVEEYGSMGCWVNTGLLTPNLSLLEQSSAARGLQLSGTTWRNLGVLPPGLQLKARGSRPS